MKTEIRMKIANAIIACTQQCVGLDEKEVNIVLDGVIEGLQDTKKHYITAEIARMPHKGEKDGNPDLQDGCV
jgi:hypothetical protein